MSSMCIWLCGCVCATVCMCYNVYYIGHALVCAIVYVSVLQCVCAIVYVCMCYNVCVFSTVYVSVCVLHYMTL